MRIDAIAAIIKEITDFEAGQSPRFTVGLNSGAVFYGMNNMEISEIAASVVVIWRGDSPPIYVADEQIAFIQVET